MRASTDVLSLRLRDLLARAEARRWEIRQLGHAGGAWYRLQRLLAYAETAWAISDADAEALIAAGHSPEPAGLELEPPRRYFVVDEAALAGLSSAREVPLRASPELLACRTLALLPFEGLHPHRGSR